ncbi:hypothetical protein Poli38472_000022 [Pythium oligandrum]|uniref:protein-tyrosine-phosphatase n=1 Tax=Pythium oligandrum TaxID=41045 RepID=A0A8K1CBB6_PYTOL|nr:hypothetical protein Poli38472_000022 [Pythium oligandrum]|eukprot:TMW59980.1 hypothetical protein Poli38472_000022 [Pythium oligandrum]
MAADDAQSPQHTQLTKQEIAQDSRLDVPGVIDEQLLVGSVEHARDEQLLKHLQVDYVLDAENPRKRTPESPVSVSVGAGQVNLDDDYSYETFKLNVQTASDLIHKARSSGRTVFIYCTHGNNESVVVCMAYLLLAEEWTLERAFKHIQQKRPACAPRKAYIDKLRQLERETHGHVTLRSAVVGPSMLDLMRGLRGETGHDDADETASQLTDTDAAESTLERASIQSNMSVVTGLHNGSSLRETMMIAERDDEHDLPPRSSRISPSQQQGRKNAKKDCMIM